MQKPNYRKETMFTQGQQVPMAASNNDRNLTNDRNFNDRGQTIVLYPHTNRCNTQRCTHIMTPRSRGAIRAAHLALQGLHGVQGKTSNVNGINQFLLSPCVPRSPGRSGTSYADHACLSNGQRRTLSALAAT